MSEAQVAVAVPCFDQLTMIKESHNQRREAKFEMDLRKLVNHVLPKLQNRKKMMKKMESKSNKGKEEMCLTKFRFNSFAPLSGHCSTTQRWMLFRATFELWPVVVNSYGRKFFFRIVENKDTKSVLRYNLYLCWGTKPNNTHTWDAFLNYKRPSHLVYDPRAKYYYKAEKEKQARILQEKDEQLKQQKIELKTPRTLIAEEASIPAPSRQAPVRQQRPPLPREQYVPEYRYGTIASVTESELGKMDEYDYWTTSSSTSSEVELLRSVTPTGKGKRIKSKSKSR